jgi:hypothetical protein
MALSWPITILLLAPRAVVSYTLFQLPLSLGALGMPPPTTNTDHARIADNLRRTVELTELGLALRQAALQQRDPQGKSLMTQVMHEIRLAKEQAWPQTQS